MTRDEMDVVSAVQAALADKVGKDRFDVWFGAHARFQLTEEALTVRVVNRFYLDWLRNNFRRALEDACQQVTGRTISVAFEVSGGAGDPANADVPPATLTAVLAANGIADGTTDGAAGAAADPRPVRIPVLPWEGSPPRAVVIPLVKSTTGEAIASPRRRGADLGSFLIGESNRLAHTAAREASERPGSISPLMLVGPASVGKTHLLEGICGAARRKQPGLTAIYLTAEQFTTYFLAALRGSGLPSFRRKYRGVQLLAIDDVNFFSGKRATLIELLHTVDTFLREGRQVVLAADRMPAEMPELGAELVGRLQGGLACRVALPEPELRRQILGRMAAEQGLDLPDDVLDFVAERAAVHARELAGALKRLHATSLAWGQPITRGLAESALADLVKSTSRQVRLPDIDQAVRQVFHLPPASLQSGGRGKNFSHPRMLAMWLARKHTRAALSEIGDYFGHRSHSTVISAQKKISDWAAAPGTLAFAGHECSLQEAIRRVEASLHAG